MKAILPLIACLAMQLAAQAKAPAPTSPTPIQPFGKIEKSDLELKSCEFEKDANALVLFEKADVYYDGNLNIVVEEHRRIKIFNDNGKDYANVKIEYDGGNRFESITGLQAETINLNGDKIEITKVDKSQIFNQTIDKVQNQYTFTFPNVKPGSVIEYKYKRFINSFTYIPSWYFQSDIPTRYSELDTTIPDWIIFNTPMHFTQAFVKNVHKTQAASLGTGADAFTYTNEINERALADVHSLPDEPYMSSMIDNLQGISFNVESIRPTASLMRDYANTWPKVGEAIATDVDFGGQTSRKLLNEEAIIAKAKSLKTNDERINYLFNEVRNALKWNNSDTWYTNVGTRTAWDKKTGNATEINLILYHLLKQSGVNAFPMVVSTRGHGKVNPIYPYVNRFNRAVVYVPVDSTKNYVLDASGKYNAYNEIPEGMLNTFGLLLDKENHNYLIKLLEKHAPCRKAVFVSADISPAGQMSGTANITSSSYNRLSSIKAYKTDGEKKYLEALTAHDNNLKVSDFKIENMEVDTLPLAQSMAFKLDLTGSDGTYIYFAPNLFSTLANNPFLSENRFTDIDFGYLNNVAVSGLYKLPAGYKVDALPKNINMVTPDKSISFKRYCVEENGIVSVRFSIDYQKSVYYKEDYPVLHEFYKKLQEMLNEQVVLKKS